MNNRSRERCNGPQCENPARPESEFCSEACKKAAEQEMDAAPYGDQYHFPAPPMP